MAKISPVSVSSPVREKPALLRPQDQIVPPKSKITELKDRVFDHYMDSHISYEDTHGMMRHILDCLGALKYAIKDDQRTSFEERRVFRDAAISICERIGAEFPIDEGTGVENIIECFPDTSKKRDGRNWLPLHWASVLDTSEADFREMSHTRPLVAAKDHLNGLINTDTTDHSIVDYGVGTGLDGQAKYNYDSLNISIPDHVEGLLPIHFMASNQGKVTNADKQYQYNTY